MAVINVQNWSVEQVVDWITGLDSTLCIYAGEFGSNLICGEKLLTLMTGDLEYLIGIKQIGDQLLLHDAIQTLRDEVSTPWTTLQTLSLSLSVRCKNYRSELTQQKQKFQDKAKELEALNHHGHHGHHMHHHHHEGKSQGNHAPVGKSNKLRLETIPTTSLASASYLLDAGKVLIRWLTRFPFLGKLNYDEISRKLTKHCFELAMLSQRDTFADNAIEEVQYLCTKIIELCEVLIHSNDSLVIQPAGIDIITLRKRTEQDWGLQFESSYWGLHQITGVKLSSPAQQSGHLERGDEILQVNYQTVLAWPQTSVIGLLHENENEVIITVKRRPRHASTNLLLLGGHQNNMYLNKIPNRKSFFERKEKEKARDRERIVEKRVLQLMEEERTLADKRIVEEEYEEEKKLEHKADARFWKLYPKPKYLIKRRATVTGASPTDTRPPVTFINDETSPNGSSNDVPVPRVLHAVVHHRRSTPVTTLTEHDATPIMQLLNPPHVHRPPLDKSRSAPEEDTGNHQDIKPVVRQTKVVESDDDVFVSPNSLPLAYVQPPTPKPRLSRSSIPDTDAFKLDPSDLVLVERERKVTVEALPDVLDHSVGPPPVPKRSADTCLSSTEKPTRRECPPEVVARRHVTPVEVVARRDGNPTEVVEKERRTLTPLEVVERKHAPPVEVVERKHVSPAEVVERKHAPPAEVVERKHVPPVEVVERKHAPSAEVVARRDVNPIEVAERKHAPPAEVVERKHVPPVEVASRQDVTAVERKHLNPIEVVPRKDVAVHNERKKEEPRLTPPQVPERPHKVLNRTNEPHQHQQSNEKAAVSILHRGILHIRSQLRKQSSSNSASALPAYGGSTSSIPSALMICSSSPRWIRQNAVFYSNNILEILNPVSRSCSVSSTTGIQGNNIKSNTFRVQITKTQKPNDNEFYLMQATEVHSRPFAFKISNADSVTYYLAAESQVELDAWLSVLSTGVVVGGACAKPLHDRTMLQRALGGLSSAGDSGRRNFARAPYKRSISLGSQSPNVSSTNLSCVNQGPPQSTPPPQPHNISPKYGSSSSLHVKQRCINAETSPTRLLNRSKSSSLKTDWFLRNSSSNISSITITSKKITKSQVTQYPTPNSTPTKQPNMPMMGVAMKTKKNNGSSSSSPTRKYMCPNCCNVVKVDMSTQTDNGNNLKVVFFNEESRV
ncbi:unnamed protein product [Orchesella dallaii]|uniref:Connector enhancer of kinase suppressor of ras 2 n=1 Tax=Orchesella dallaii TaxID=48710 RepID=A0ABP1QM84_9HEXA